VQSLSDDPLGDVVVLAESSFAPPLWRAIARTPRESWSPEIPSPDGLFLFYRLAPERLSADDRRGLEVQAGRSLRRRREAAERETDLRLKRENVALVGGLAMGPSFTFRPRRRGAT
jgi:hypothetical protein